LRPLSLLIVLAPTLAGAQPRSLTLAEAMRLADRASEDVAVARAGVERAHAEEDRARSELLPQLSGSASYERTIRSEFQGISFGGMDGVDGEALGDLPFGRANTVRYGLSAQQNLWTGGRITARRRLASAARKQAELGVTGARAQAILVAAQVYLDAVLTAQLTEIAEATLAQAERTLAATRVGFSAGAQPEIDLLRATVSRDNQRPIVSQRRMERDLTLLRLKQLLDLPMEQQLRLVTPLDQGLDTMPRAPDRPRIAVAQVSLLVAMREAGLDMARSQRLPTIVLSSQFGRVAYPESLDEEWRFRTNWTAGVGLAIPIFTGGRITADVRAARADVAEARARLEQARELARLDERSAREELASVTGTWQAMGGTVAQAERAYEIAELRYREGLSTQLELADARLLLEQARANRARAARDVQLARLRLSLLPELPLVQR
jgi:outer membrane protein